MKPFLFLFALGSLASCSAPSSMRDFDPLEKPGQALARPAFSSADAKRTFSPDLLQPPPGPYPLGPGDKLDIEILSETGSRAETFVTPDGKLYFNLLPALDVAGKSTTQVQQELEKALAKYYKSPQVSVNLIEAVSQRVWVLGRVNSPGNYSIKRPLRVLDALSLAGGLFTSRFTGTTEELADLQHSFIVRNGSMLPVDFQKLVREGDMRQNVYLQANDFIYLPSSLTNEVYVLGAVVEPRPVGFMNDMNLMAALGRGLGLRPDADLSHVSIIRGSLTDPKIATVNAKDVLAGKAPNLRLEPGDIVFVPGAGQISPSNMASEAINTFVRVIAANEGGRAGASDAEPVGVNLNLGAQ